MDPDLEELASIIELLDGTEFTEFRFEKGDMKLSVSRGHMLPIAVTASPGGLSPKATTSATPPSLRTPVVGLTPAPGNVHVASPMLGSFYRSPKPGEAPFVEVGATVAVGDSLCIIEVMKLMSSVVSDVAGEVVAVLARDGELVEFEQPLFEIRPLL